MGETKQMSFQAMVAREGDDWVAHCLELDIVSTGPTPWSAIDDLVGAVAAQLQYAREHDNFEYLFRPAPEEAWRRLGEILKGPHQTIVRRIDDSERNVNLETQLAA